MATYQQSRSVHSLTYRKRQAAAERSAARAARLAIKMAEATDAELLALVRQGQDGPADYPTRTAAFNELKARRAAK